MTVANGLFALFFGSLGFRSYLSALLYKTIIMDILPEKMMNKIEKEISCLLHILLGKIS